MTLLMSAWLRKPYNVLVLLAVLTFAGSFIDLSVLDIHLHDTYFIIDQKYIYWAYSAVLLVMALLYRLCHSYLLSAWLSWMHIASLAILLGWVTLARAFIDLSILNSKSLLFLLVIINIFALPVNVIAGMLRKLLFK
ncbi:hypothetical protein [Taibaiella sp. KBW10]|uniref:hypothetical protein n=1 Tax=Taibaiella sp. KBW10 TaxID=2153357 RepID=UPI001F4914F4|nr:hypothetical protein [Taibaiella sp. KBW10]